MTFLGRTLMPAALALGLNSPSIPSAEAAAFVRGNPMVAACFSHTATLLPNGKVLVAGGRDSSYAGLSSAELYDPATGMWTATGSLIAARYGHTATLLSNGKVLVAGGIGSLGGYTISKAELYDSASGTWTTTGELNTERWFHTATLLADGKVLVAGGESQTGNTGYTCSSAEVYDPATGTWTPTGAMSCERSSHTATLLPNGKVLVAGHSFVLWAELYDPTTGTWTLTGPLSAARWNHTATLLPNGKVLVAGGSDSGSAELYDPTTGKCTLTGAMSAVRFWHTATLLSNGRVVAVGGVYKYYVSGSGWQEEYPSSADVYDPATGMWTATGALNTVRDSHTATLLPNGNVLVAGGVGNTLSSTELYDLAAPGWTATGALSIGREDHTATLLSDGKVLVAGGMGSRSGGSGSDYLSSAELYDPATGRWTATNSLNKPRINHTATLLPNGKVLVAGGYNSGTGHLSSAELYDPATGRWTATGSLITARSYHTATLLPNGKVLVAGGYRPDSLSSAELYDPATGSWTATGSLIAARVWHTATLLPNGKVLVAGGYMSSAELYDPASGSWTATGSLIAARVWHTATLLPNGKVLVAGGADISSAELYDPATGTWTAAGAMRNERASHTATLLPIGKVLVAGGGGGDLLSSAELYDPATAKWTATGSLITARSQHTATLLPNGKALVAGGATYGPIYRASSAELYDKAKATGTVTFTNLSQTYNGTPRSVTAATTPPGLTVDFTYNGSANAPTNAGTYAVIGTVDDLDYQGSATNTLVVLPATLTVTADNKFKTPGTPVPSLTFTITGFANGDKQGSAVSGSPDISTTATAVSDPGAYPITVADGTLAAANYTFTFVNGTLMVGDNLPPSLAITSHSDLQIVAVATITLTGTASDAGQGDNGIKSVTVNGLLATNGTASGNNVASWSRGVSLLVGTNTIKVVASDNASPPNSVTNVIRIISDTVWPTLTITSPTANQRWSNMWFTVKGTARDNLQVTSVWCQVNGASTYLAQTTNGWTDWTASVLLTPRTNLISAYAVDSAGNSSTTNSVNLVYVVTNRLQVAAAGKGTLSPNYSNAWLEIGLPYSMTATPASGFVFTNWTISTNWLGGVTTNAATVKFMMASNLTLQVNFVDVTKPTLAISSPASGQRMTNALATIRGTASDNWRISGVWYQLNSGAWSQPATTNSWTNWTTTVQLIAGTNIVKAYAVDWGGNSSTTNTLNVVSSNTFRLQLGFDAAQPLASNGLNLMVQLSPGLNGRIQVSTDLLNWATLTDFVGSNTTLHFRDSAATNCNGRFYRAVTP
jgi:uncharacterized delta-60 repeat protein